VHKLVCFKEIEGSDVSSLDDEQQDEIILQAVAIALSQRSSRLAPSGRLDSEFQRQAKQILAEARMLIRDRGDSVPDVSVDYPTTDAIGSTGQLRAEQNLHPAESLMAAEILFDVALPQFAIDPSLVHDAASEAIRAARSLHHAIWRRFPPGAIAYAEILRQRLSDAHYESRLRLSRDLHDRIAHSILAGAQRVELGMDSDDAAGAVDHQNLNDALEILRGALEEVQGLAGELRERVGDSTVAQALLRFVGRNGEHNVPVAIISNGSPRSIPGWMKEELFTITVEAIRNAWAHAEGSSQVKVTFNWSEQNLAIIVSDDGHGFVVGRAPKGSIGVAGMAERAKLIGAEFVLDSSWTAGTLITLTLPVRIPGNSYPN
jgi:signal transduction histidine kinase